MLRHENGFSVADTSAALVSTVSAFERPQIVGVVPNGLTQLLRFIRPEAVVELPVPRPIEGEPVVPVAFDFTEGVKGFIDRIIPTSPFKRRALIGAVAASNFLAGPGLALAGGRGAEKVAIQAVAATPATAEKAEANRPYPWKTIGNNPLWISEDGTKGVSNPEEFIKMVTSKKGSECGERLQLPQEVWGQFVEQVKSGKYSDFSAKPGKRYDAMCYGVGDVSVIPNVMWSGKKNLSGRRVVIDHEGVRYIIDTPDGCANMAVETRKAPPKKTTVTHTVPRPTRTVPDPTVTVPTRTVPGPTVTGPTRTVPGPTVTGPTRTVPPTPGRAPVTPEIFKTLVTAREFPIPVPSDKFSVVERCYKNGVLILRKAIKIRSNPQRGYACPDGSTFVFDEKDLKGYREENSHVVMPNMHGDSNPRTVDFRVNLKNVEEEVFLPKKPKSSAPAASKASATCIPGTPDQPQPIVMTGDRDRIVYESIAFTGTNNPQARVMQKTMDGKIVAEATFAINPIDAKKLIIPVKFTETGDFIIQTDLLDGSLTPAQFLAKCLVLAEIGDVPRTATTSANTTTAPAGTTTAPAGTTTAPAGTTTTPIVSKTPPTTTVIATPGGGTITTIVPGGPGSPPIKP